MTTFLRLAAMALTSASILLLMLGLSVLSGDNLFADPSPGTPADVGCHRSDNTDSCSDSGECAKKKPVEVCAWTSKLQTKCACKTP